jgi:phage terminase small subunit
MPEKPEEQNKLNIRQLKFIDGLLEGKTQKKAYIDAGYETKDDNVAMVNASQLLRNPKVQEELDRRIEDLKSRNKLRLYRISEAALQRLVSILQSDEKIADSNVKADLIKYVLDGVGLKPAEEHNLNVKGKLETNLSEEQMNGLIELAHKAIKPDMQTQDKKPNKE